MHIPILEGTLKLEQLPVVGLINKVLNIACNAESEMS
jgi:hypothetical protein